MRFTSEHPFPKEVYGPLSPFSVERLTEQSLEFEMKDSVALLNTIETFTKFLERGVHSDELRSECARMLDQRFDIALLGKDVERWHTGEQDYLWLWEKIGWKQLRSMNKLPSVQKVAENGYLECLKYVHENGCSWDKSVAEAAAANGHLQCLRYLHANGCSWDKTVSEAAMANGQLACLQYLHENGCSWDEGAVYSAGGEGSVGLFAILARERVFVGQGCCIVRRGEGSVGLFAILA